MQMIIKNTMASLPRPAPPGAANRVADASQKIAEIHYLREKIAIQQCGVKGAAILTALYFAVGLLRLLLAWLAGNTVTKQGTDTFWGTPIIYLFVAWGMLYFYVRAKIYNLPGRPRPTRAE